jgi:MFS family permease
VLVYMPTFARTQLNLPLDEAFLAQSVGLIGTIFLIPLFGALSDSIGRRPILIGTQVVYLALAYPLFAWLKESPSFDRLLLVQIILSGLLAAYVGPLSTALARSIHQSSRFRGVWRVLRRGHTGPWRCSRGGLLGNLFGWGLRGVGSGGARCPVGHGGWAAKARAR